MIVAGTGHRPDKLGGYGPSALQDWIRQKIREKLVELGATTVISGMALGFDQWLAEEAYALGIPFIAAVPFVGQESQWPEESKRKYRELLLKARRVVVVSKGGYKPSKMQTRNVWMVDNSDVLLAAYDESPEGGTANCYWYAEGKKKRIVRIDPRDFSLV